MPFYKGHTINVGRKHPPEFGKAISDRQRGKLQEQLRAHQFQPGEMHWAWKGDAVKYRALHQWIEKTLGRPTVCEHCGNVRKVMQWANKSSEYRRDPSDWIRLCKRCHWIFDGAFIPSRKGLLGWLKGRKDYHISRRTEFKPGHVMSPEVRAKISTTLRRRALEVRQSAA